MPVCILVLVVGSVHACLYIGTGYRECACLSVLVLDIGSVHACLYIGTFWF